MPVLFQSPVRKLSKSSLKKDFQEPHLDVILAEILLLGMGTHETIGTWRGFGESTPPQIPLI